MIVGTIARTGLLCLATAAFCALPTQSLSQEPGRAFTTDATAPITLPSVFDGRVLLQGSVNGHTLWFHLDSGASTYLMGTEDATAVGLSVDSGSDRAAPVDLIIGGVHAPAARFYVHHYGYDVGGRHVAGIVGAPLLFSFVVTIDYGRKQVIVYPRGTFDPASTGVEATPITIDGRESYTNVCFGSTCAPFLLDTGSGISSISPGFAQKIGLSKPIGRTHLYGYYDADATEYVAPSVTLGGSTLHGLQIAVVPRETQFVGIIGRDVLKYFAVTFDWPDSKVYLAPEARNH